MAQDTFGGIARKILLRCPTASLTLAMDWTQSAFREILERKRWSWLLKKGQLTTTNQYNTGTATTGVGSVTVQINAPGVVAATMVNQQFRIATALPISTITAVDTVLNTLTLSQAWYPTVQTAQNYSIYQAYVALPSDFHAFVSVIDPNYAQPVAFNASVAQLDNLDPQRAAAGSPPRCLAYLDYLNGIPRYELWPHQRTASVYPIVYESRPIDAFDAGAAIPALLPSDVILERSMMYCSAWPGSTTQNPNPYFNKQTLALHSTEFEKRIALIEKQDNEVMQQQVWYQSDQQRQTAVVSGSWMQSHSDY